MPPSEDAIAMFMSVTDGTVDRSKVIKFLEVRD
jgi:hypothetical protein